MAPDTLSISKELRAAGFSEEQADVLATQIAAQPEDLVTRQDLALAVAQLERRIDQLDSRIDQVGGKLDSRIDRVDGKIDRVESRLVIKLGAIMAGGVALVLSALAIAVAVLLNQLG